MTKRQVCNYVTDTQQGKETRNDRTDATTKEGDKIELDKWYGVVPPKSKKTETFDIQLTTYEGPKIKWLCRESNLHTCHHLQSERNV